MGRQPWRRANIRFTWVQPRKRQKYLRLDAQGFYVVERLSFLTILLLYYFRIFNSTNALNSLRKQEFSGVFTRQGSQVRTLHRPPIPLNETEGPTGPPRAYAALPIARAVRAANPPAWPRPTRHRLPGQHLPKTGLPRPPTVRWTMQPSPQRPEQTRQQGAAPARAGPRPG